MSLRWRGVMRRLEISTGQSVFCPFFNKEQHIEVCGAGCGSGFVTDGHVECYADDVYADYIWECCLAEAKRRLGCQSCAQ